MRVDPRLWADSPRTRAKAVRDAGPYELRRVLFTDRDANVRAAAARRVDREAWLLDAIGDRSPLVRDSVLRSLAKHGGAAAREVVRALVSSDRMWWVRRSAIYALAAIAGAGELDTFVAAMTDPFWRVRYAAVRVLGVLGARDLGVRRAVEDATGTAAVFLRSSWGPTELEAPARAAAGTSKLPAELLDPDPAVVTARLAAHAEWDALALVELLCDPHAPLRELAAERVAASGDEAAYRAALEWLEEPRVPHVAETVERLLDGLGDAALPLAQQALAGDRRGAIAWAVRWVVSVGWAELHDAALAAADRDVSLRRAVAKLATADTLVAWGDVDELHRRRDVRLFEVDARCSPASRALQVDAAARTGRWELVEAALADAHHGPRAVAVASLVRAGRADGSAYAADEDPAIREAAISPVTVATLVGDPDPWVARAAAERLWIAKTPEARVAATRVLASSPDARARAGVCAVDVAGDAGLLAAIVAALGDRDPGVRAAAHQALLDVPDDQVRALSPTVHSLAWLARDLGDAEVANLAGHIESADVPWDLETAGISLDTRPPGIGRTAVPRRPFGRVGFDVAPLVISGAYDVSIPALERAHAAGVDAYFWEPSYESLTRFVKRTPAARVIAGSYHAEPDAIRADVERACRWLRRDCLDVFLLFWSRSPARVDDGAYRILDDLRRAGLIRAAGFSTHDRTLARTAISQSPWDVVMIRHSAAHPGIESELLPHARAAGTAILTFSALCYGRMLSGDGAPSAEDCYRYSISQPGVTACISAPRRSAELDANLAVLDGRALAEPDLARLRAHGERVRAENQRFNALMRQPTRDAALAARDLLAAELPPADEIAIRPLPRFAARTARTSLGSARRRT